MTAVPVQPIVLAGGLWSCAWCAATLEERGITHRDNCRWIAEIRAADPATETEGFRAYKAGVAAGRAEGAAAERKRIIMLASQLRVSIPADHPEGAQASFADYLRVTAPGQEDT